MIGGGLEAEVTVYANDEYRALLEQLGNELRFVFNYLKSGSETIS